MSESDEMGASKRPAMIFLGVSTSASAVHNVFERWVECLGRPLSLEPRDMPLDTNPSTYRSFVEELRRRAPAVRGALITSHKARVFDAASDLFDELSPVARRLGEVGMIYWRSGRLVGDANDALSTAQVARRLLLTSSAWLNGSRDAIILGGGGAGVALANTLIEDVELGCHSVVIAEVNVSRVSKVEHRLFAWQTIVPVRVVQVGETSNELVSSLRGGGLIANATGLGKDKPGSPITRAVNFPQGAIVWEFNYRFVPQTMPTFLQLAASQAIAKGLTIEDGRDYFVWGWLGVMSNILGLSPAERYVGFRTAADAMTLNG